VVEAPGKAAGLHVQAVAVSLTSGVLYQLVESWHMTPAATVVLAAWML
jgi:hypothetical protein